MLACRRRGDRLLIQVWDTGPGMDEDTLARVFQEFHRGATARIHHDRGLGLGLAIVERVAGLLDHPVSVRSRVGRGSVFSVAVPLGH